MPISSLVITTHTGHTDEVAEALRALDGVTVSDIQAKDLIVLTETGNRREDKVLWDRIEGTEHVDSMHLVYHNFEDLEASPS